MKKLVDLRELINPAHEDINSYAITCTVSRERDVGPGELRAFSAGLMAAIAKECFARGAKDIGHIKAYAEHAGGFLYADTLGTPADVTVEGRDGDPAARFTLVINSVIYGLSAEAVKDATEAALKDQLLKFGLVRGTETNNRE
ncbi:MAG: hypothetical protein M1510_11000 [Nitrospirae bacterium]|nr:hypothetical protein [Nitrospirota bacterium]MCL5238791.1 hypothetical protein [Nitrospirota bacterium]